MTQIIHQKRGSQEVEVGDIFFVEENSTYLKLLASNDGHQFTLYDMEDDSVVSAELSHPVHVINHMKKHYGEFELIKSDRVTITIK